MMRGESPAPLARGGAARASAVAEPQRRSGLQIEVAQRSAVSTATHLAQAHLLGLQRSDGHWCAELEGDTILESEYVMLLWFLGKHEDPRIEQACRTLRRQQLPEGGWAIYPGGPPDPSPSVKAYFALRLGGDSEHSEHMQRARESIQRMGGIAACNSFTKIYLAMFGQWPWRRAPVVPPELILAPRWFPINIYEMSSWSRAIVVPLAILWAHRPLVEVPVDIAELDTGDPPPRPGDTWRERFWFAFFRFADRATKVAEALRLFTPTRRLALRRCEQWTVARLERSAGLGAIFPAIVNAAVAMRLQGYDEDHPYVKSQLDELEKLEILEPPVVDHAAGDARGEPSDGLPHLRVQPCQSPVWDTSLSLNALLESGIDPTCDAVQSAARWLLDKEVRCGGDWREKNPEVEPSGWFFEYANAFYPDCDDTAEVLAVLAKLSMNDPGDEARRHAAVGRALAWQLSMQNRDGGWGAFDRECNRELLTYVPFADHNAMIDPSTVDVTARTVEALALHLGVGHPAVVRGLAFIERQQEDDGSWFGRWGSNYIYGTWLALCALSSCGLRRASSTQRGVDWLLAVQLSDGGWGETLASYVDASRKGRGPSTSAQTAWALMGLLAVHGEDLVQRRTPAAKPGFGPRQGDVDEQRLDRVFAATQRGVGYLLHLQQDDGSWHDEQWTGTGFPAVFYLRYHYYDRYFPLQALAAAERYGIEIMAPETMAAAGPRPSPGVR